VPNLGEKALFFNNFVSKRSNRSVNNYRYIGRKTHITDIHCMISFEYFDRVRGQINSIITDHKMSSEKAMSRGDYKKVLSTSLYNSTRDS